MGADAAPTCPAFGIPVAEPPFSYNVPHQMDPTRIRFTTRLVPAAAWLLLVTGGAFPAVAQVDFTGQWAPLYHEDTIERIPGPELGDYTGLPLNEAGRLRADTWDADRISIVQEYQCRPHSADYALRGLAPLRVSAQYDDATQRITGFETYIGAYENRRTILGGRVSK